MLGFSLPKIILLIIIILLIWNIFKYLEKKSKNKASKSIKENENNSEEALIECKKCGSFYSLEVDKKCPLC